MDDDLRARWAALAGGSEPAEHCGRDLLARWAEPHRHYHALGHLRAVLDAIEILLAETPDPDAVRLAAWFHDAVYDGRRGDDEAASAELAAARLPRLGFGSQMVDEVRRLVLLTITHDPAPEDANGATLCDADLAVLGGSPLAYRAYSEAVRCDYNHVSDSDFRAGRIDVLERLLAKDPLFGTTTARTRWEAAARRNLRAELGRLRSLRPAD